MLESRREQLRLLEEQAEALVAVLRQRVPFAKRALEQLAPLVSESGESTHLEPLALLRDWAPVVLVPDPVIPPDLSNIFTLPAFPVTCPPREHVPRKRSLEELRSAQRNIAGRHDMGRTGIPDGAGTGKPWSAEQAPSLDVRSNHQLAGKGAIYTARLDTRKWASDGEIFRLWIACNVALLAQTNQTGLILKPRALLL